MNNTWTKTVRRLGSLKEYFLRDEVRYRRVMFGICRGSYIPLNLRRNIRVKFGIYELEVAGYVKKFARPGACCYDIGASHGYYTLALARLVNPGPVYAFESDPSLCVTLKETLSLNPGLATNVKVVNTFLADSVNNAEKRVTLDYLVYNEGFRSPDFVKMDIDGPEFEVLQGGKRMLRECRPRLIVETHSPELESNCKQLLENAQYLVKIVKNSVLLQEHRPTALNRWLVAEPEAAALG
jgi:precorrin-6B methylase 2